MPHPISAPTSLARLIACLPWLAPLAWPHLASAQTREPTAPLPTVTVTERSASGLNKPASTGSNLDLAPLQVPASIDVITREQLNARGDASLVDAITRATGISSLAHPGNSGSALAARGFTDSTSVMRLYDGTRQYGGVSVSFPFDTWSVDRIEVLRGPASVIHGDGAIGGVVNVIPKKPTRGPIQNEVQATVGTQDRLGLAFGSGGAVQEKLSYRLDVSGERSDGWVNRGDSRNATFSGAVQLDVSPRLVVKLSHAFGEQHPMRYFGMPLVNGQALPALREKNYNVEDSQIRYRDQWTELAAQWAPTGDLVVRSKLYHVQSKRYWRNAEGYDYDTSTGLINRSDSTEIQHDQTQTGNTTHATLTGNLLGMVNQVSLGFDASTSSFQHTNNTYTGSSGPVDLLNPVPGLYQSTIPFIPRYRNKGEQFAVFAEDRLELNQAWSVVAGLRHDHADITRQNLLNGTQAFDKRYAHTGWRIGTVYQPRPDLSVYAQYSEAADPVAALLMLSAANSEFKQATGRQVEVGVKQSFWDKTGDWTLALYQIKKNNLLTVVPTASDPAARQQVGQRSSLGIEGTVSLALNSKLQLDANAALLRARYDDFREAGGSRNGKVPTDVPERLANVWLGWQFMPGWTASGGLRHVGKRYADNANTLVLPAYTTADLALKWQATADTTVSLRGFNVFDKLYFTTAYYTNTQWFVGPGRRAELTVHHRF